MANTAITVSKKNGVLVPSQSSVQVVEGDSVAFSTADGTAVTLFFSPDSASILSPAPSGPVEVPAGGSLSFTFTKSGSGAFSVFFEPDAATPPASFPVQATTQLLLEIDPDQVGFEVQSSGGPRTG